MNTKQTTSLLAGADIDSPSVDTAVESSLFQESEDIENTKTGLYSTLVVCSAAVGGFMFGYDTACISSILIFLDQSQFTLTSKEKEIITGITSIGSFFGAIGAAVFSTMIGRKLIITLCCTLFALSAVELGLSNTVPFLIIGRFVVGLAVGAASMIVPVYISEVSPSKKRGRLLTLNSVSTTGGQFIANLIAYGIRNTKNNWRWMFVASGIPPLLFLCVVKFIPESPRYLLLHNNFIKAHRGLSMLYPNATKQQILDKIESIQHDIKSNEVQMKKPVHERLFGSPIVIRALTVGCVLMFFQQAVGFNSFMYYGATIFKIVGVGDPLIVSILISGTNFLFTFVALKFIDKVGRRKMLLSTVWIMGLGLFFAAFGFYKAQLPTDKSIESTSLNFYSILLVVSVLVYVGSYASALGTIPWSSVEFLSLEARAPGAAMIACTGWITNSIVSVTFLSLMNTLSPSGVCIMFASVCFVAWGCIYGWYPEVAGLSLEEIREVFRNGIDIHYVKRRRDSELTANTQI